MTAEPGKLAAGAVRVVRRTAGASVDDQQVRELRPGLRRHDRADVGFDDLGIGGVGEADEAGQTAHVGVDRESGLAEGVAEYHVRGFPSDAGQFEQSFHRIREFAVELLDDGFRRLQNMVGFRPVESAGEDRLFELFPSAARERFGVRPALEEVARDHVHAFVRTLGGQDRGDEELERRHVLQKTFLGTVNGQQFVVDLFCQ